MNNSKLTSVGRLGSHLLSSMIEDNLTKESLKDSDNAIKVHADLTLKHRKPEDLLDVMDFTNNPLIASIMKFNIVAGNRVSGNPTWLSRDEAKLEVSMLQEELNELAEALESNDLSEVLDAICDIFVVLMGTAGKTGLIKLFPLALDVVNENNLNKFHEDDSGNLVAIKNTKGKIQKPEGFENINLEEILHVNKIARLFNKIQNEGA